MKKIAFIGAGKMAGAMVNGLLARGIAPAQITCTCGDDPTGPELARQTGIGFTHELDELLAKADVVVLACKPQQLGELPVPAAAAQKLFVSILAGVTLEKLSAKFPQARNIVRAMPNLPGQIGEGITAYAPQKELSAADKNAVELVLGSLGEILALPESQLDAVTAVSGSGPAYVFEFAASLMEGALACGLDEPTAKKLVFATLGGSVSLLKKSPLSPQELRDAVTSKGGTTAAALGIFKENDFRLIVTQALLAAKNRSEELSKL